MWLPQGGALKIENLQFTQYSIIMLARSYTQSIREGAQTHRYTQIHTERENTHTHKDRQRERERETVTTNHHNNS